MYPHINVRIYKKTYEHTRKKARHFTIHLRYDYDSCIWIMYITVIIIVSLMLVALCHALYTENQND